MFWKEYKHLIHLKVTFFNILKQKVFQLSIFVLHFVDRMFWKCMFWATCNYVCVSYHLVNCVIVKKINLGHIFKFNFLKYLHWMIFDNSYLFLQFGNFFIELDVLIVIFGHEIWQPSSYIFHSGIWKYTKGYSNNQKMSSHTKKTISIYNIIWIRILLV